MFTVSIKLANSVCSKMIIRNLRNRKLNVPGPNPGLDKRVQAFQEEGLKIVDNDAEEFVEQSESDFYNIGEVYNEHLNETLVGKLELRHHIIKEKYFKENMPNLLTWSEKEQIRHLATTHPDEWTPEKIAESFPVTIPVVKKLLKFTWKPASELRISRHDASAMRNWKMLKEGLLDIPEDLRQHFLKFSERTIPPLNKISIKSDVTQENIGEFENIIRRCAAKEDQKNDSHKFNNTYINKNNGNMKMKDMERVTLDELTAKIKKRIEKGTDVNVPDQMIVNMANSASLEATPVELKNEVELFENEDKEITIPKESNESDTAIMDYPERIRIPKKAYKRGATYKVKDCFYDHNGKFLYRVLGLTN